MRENLNSTILVSNFKVSGPLAIARGSIASTSVYKNFRIIVILLYIKKIVNLFYIVIYCVCVCVRV